MTLYDNVKFTQGSNIVFLATTRVEENWTNAVKIIPIPTTSSTPNTPLAVNLNKVEDRFTITGFLNYGKLDATDTATTAKAKKDLLKTMFSQRSTITMTDESASYTVSVEKYQITRRASDTTDSADSEVVYDVIVTVVVSGDAV